MAVRKLALLALALVLTACASSPVGVARIDPSAVHQRLTRSALSARQLSPRPTTSCSRRISTRSSTTTRRRRWSGCTTWRSRAPAARRSSSRSPRRRSCTPSARASAPTTWRRPSTPGPTSSPRTRRRRRAPSTRASGSPRISTIADSRRRSRRGEPADRLNGGTLDLPFGQLDVAFDPAQLVWQGRRMTGFAPIAEFRVFGLQAHYREPGLGAPMAASLDPLADENQPKDLLRADLTLPVTVLLRSPRSRTALAWPPLAGTLEVHVPDATDAVEIAGRRVPLETEPTAVLAYSLADSPIWRPGAHALLRGEGVRGRRAVRALRHRAPPPRSHPGRVRARHRLLVRAMGRDVQPPGGRRASPRPIRVLVLLLRLG